MKLEVGKWYKDRGGMRWHVDWVGEQWACGHNDNGVCMCWRADGGYYQGCQESPIDLISEWTEPKLRPFRMEEVPLGAWLTMEGKAGRYLITGAKEVDLVVAGIGGINYEHARDTCKYSMDEGSTWKPCGVLEGGE